MIKTFQYRVKGKTNFLNDFARKVNFIWNYCNETQRNSVKNYSKWLTGIDLNYLTIGTSKLLDISSETINAICEQHFESRKTAKKPWLRFRGRKSLGWIPFKARSIQHKEDYFVYRGNKIKVWYSRPIEGVIKTGSLTQDSRGRWFINICCEIKDPKPTKSNKSIGIDLGLKDMATFSNGDKIEAKQFYRNLEPQLATAQRANKKNLVRKIHIKIKNRRKDFLHKLSTKLIHTYKTIIVGDVSSSKLAKTKMAKSIYDVSWFTFKNMLEYKAIMHQVIFKIVAERFTTQTCSSCGSIEGPKGIAGLGIRGWICSCGSHHDRDVNSAINILALGH